MRYLVLLAATDDAMPEPGTPEFDADMAGFEAFDALAGPAILGGEALAGRSSCRTIRHEPGGEVTITDGPFAETVEGLGGLFVLEAADLDDVVELARHIPPLRYGSIEIRPMVEWRVAAGRPPRGVDGAAPRWLATIHGPETDDEDPDTDGWEAGAADHGRFAAEAGDAVVAAGAVFPSRSATTLRLDGGELSITDGPYAEGVEVVGGFYVLGGEREDVTALAARIPVSPGGGVTLQGVADLDG